MPQPELPDSETLPGSTPELIEHLKGRYGSPRVEYVETLTEKGRLELAVRLAQRDFVLMLDKLWKAQNER